MSDGEYAPNAPELSHLRLRFREVEVVGFKSPEDFSSHIEFVLAEGDASYYVRGIALVEKDFFQFLVKRAGVTILPVHAPQPEVSFNVAPEHEAAIEQLLNGAPEVPEVPEADDGSGPVAPNG